MSFYLGEKVFVRKVLTRRGELLSDKTWFNFWGKTDRCNSGIVVGKRSLSNGETIMAEYPTTRGSYKRTQSVAAYLVAFTLIQKPVYVSPEDMVSLEKKNTPPDFGWKRIGHEQIILSPLAFPNDHEFLQHIKQQLPKVGKAIDKDNYPNIYLADYLVGELNRSKLFAPLNGTHPLHC
jgi:hypothetical protein